MSIDVENFIKYYAIYLKSLTNKEVTMDFNDYEDKILIEVNAIKQGELKNYKEFVINIVYSSTTENTFQNITNSFALYNSLNQYYLHKINDGLSSEMIIISEILTEYFQYKDEDSKEFTSPMSVRIWIR